MNGPTKIRLLIADDHPVVRRGLRKLIGQYELKSKSHRRDLSQLEAQDTMIDQFLKLEFSTIDLPGASAEWARSRERLESLLDPNSDATQAKAKYDTERKMLVEFRAEISKCESEIAVLRDRNARADDECKRSAKRRGEGLTPEEISPGSACFPVQCPRPHQTGRVVRQ
jgi:uncharacterized protein YPO0396